MSLLAGFRVVQIGPGLAAAVCGRLLADVGAAVTCIDPGKSMPLTDWLNDGKVAVDAALAQDAVAAAELILSEGGPAELRLSAYPPNMIRRLNPTAAIVTISPFGQTGPKAEDAATDLTLFCASGIARLLTGQVDDLTEPPIRPVGGQSAFLGGLAAACAGMHAAMRVGADVDASVQEALATLAMTELTRAGLTGKSWSRRRLTDGNGATVTILPARDGYVAISPREERQWQAWLGVMGSPDWGREPRFATKPDRIAHFDALHARMSAWSRQYDKQWIADAAQAAHVPSFPLREAAEQFASAQLRHRDFYRQVETGDRAVKVPGPPFGLSIAKTGRPVSRRAAAGNLPLSGIRILDFSWVIAGPTATRYLAALGAEIIKIEAPGRGDPGRASELHTVLGQAKRGIVLDLKKPGAVEVARALAARSDVVIENYATGVMDRLGLGAAALQALNPDLLYVSASGLGRTGPESDAVAYGTLLQCYAGFAGLNRHPDTPPRVGMAWLDPMCGLMLAFIVAAGIWRRERDGGVARVDFSMIEAMLWTMAKPLLAAQLDAPPQPRGNGSSRYAPHGVYRCAGDDAWIGIAVTTDAAWRQLCAIVPALSSMAGLGCSERFAARADIDRRLADWLHSQAAGEAAEMLSRAGIATEAVANSRDLVDSRHLRERGFWDGHGAGVLPGLPWRASFGRATGPAPEHGADTDSVLADILDLSPDAIATLRQSGALG